MYYGGCRLFDISQVFKVTSNTSGTLTFFTDFFMYVFIVCALPDSCLLINRLLNLNKILKHVCSRLNHGGINL